MNPYPQRKRTRLLAAMKYRSASGILLGIAITLAGCAPAPTSRSAPTGVDATGPRPPTTLSIAVKSEPSVFGSRLGRQQGGSESDIQFALQRHLTHYDERGNLHPQLAAELPTQAAGTWLVRPDGTMRTTYKLRPNAMWHDGTPLGAKDFVFAWTVTKDPDLPVGDRGSSAQIDRIDTPDDHTLVLEWRTTNIFGNALVDEDFGPLPTHLLEQTYLTEKERLVQLTYWGRDYIGVGPYRMGEWEPGSHIVLRAYDNFYLGRPKIDTVVFRFIPSPDTVVANLLAGEVDGALGGAIDFPQALLVKGEWERAGKMPEVPIQSTHWVHIGVQFRPELAAPPEVRDVRVRRGLLHALDRKAMAEVLYEGHSPVSDTFIPPDDVKYDWVKDAIVRYDYDTRRASELLTAVGWQRGTDGNLVNAAGDRVTVPFRGTATSVKQGAMIADYWKAAGVTVDLQTLSGAQQRDPQLNQTFPAFAAPSYPLTFQSTVGSLYRTECGSEANRWSARNRGCYQNADMDRVVDSLRSALDPTEQRRLYRDLVKMHIEELPLIPLYFNVQATLFREGVVGVRGDTRPRSSYMWNVETWELR